MIEIKDFAKITDTQGSTVLVRDAGLQAWLYIWELPGVSGLNSAHLNHDQARELGMALLDWAGEAT